MMYWTGSKDIKDLLFRVLDQNAADFKAKDVVDVPAGNGVTTKKLLSFGARVQALDLFPEFFQVEGMSCDPVDLNDKLPLADESVDWIIFQEGIEHLSDQLRILRECYRVLRPQGRMILTTPNSSNLRSKLAHFVLEAETLRLLPPNEVDSVWAMASKEGQATDAASASKRIYFGHLFSIGIQRLRTLAKVAGFELAVVHPARVNWSSFFLWVLSIPWIFLKSGAVYHRSLRKSGTRAKPPQTYRECLGLMRDMNILCSGHLIAEFRKDPGFQLEPTRLESADLRKVVT